ncbi:MAG: YbhN family protein [Candidatus Nanohalobium sp.]
MDIRDLKDSKMVWFAISTAMIAGMIYFADVEKFIESVQSARVLPLIPAFVLGLSIFPLLSYVWYRVFTASGIHTTYWKALKVFMAGNFMNSVTPLGQFGGEPLMAYLVQKNWDESYEKSISSVFSADIMNATPHVTFVVGGGLYMMLFHSINQLIVQALYATLMMTVLGGLLVYLLWFEAGTIEGKIVDALRKISSFVGKGSSVVDKLEEKLAEVEESFRAIGESPRYLFKTAVVAHIGFLTQVFCFYFIALSLGFQADITPIFFVTTLAGLATFSPTPGGSGTMEAAMAGLITVFFPGTSFATGLTVAILFRITTYWPGILLGWLALNNLQKGEIE